MRPHPFGAKRIELRYMLDRLWRLSRPSIRPRTTFDEGRLQLWLPTVGKRPLPSPELRIADWAPGAASVAGLDGAHASGGATEDVPHEAPHFTLWRSNTIFLAPEAAITLLHGLPVTADDMATARPILDAVEAEQAGLVLGSDLRYWSTAASLVIDLLARQQYVPGIHVNDNQSRVSLGFYNGYRELGGYGRETVSGAWYPAFNHPQVRERVDVLIDTMPTLCRAVEEHPASEAQVADAPSSRTLLLDFVQETAEDLVGHWLVKEHVMLTLPSQPVPKYDSSAYYYRSYLYGRQSVAAHWLGGLVSPRRDLYLQAEQQHAIKMGLDRWLSGLRSYEHDTFRLCFRLVPPEVPDTPEEAVTSADAVTSAGAEAAPLVEDTALRALPVATSAEDQVSQADAQKADTGEVPPAERERWHLEYLLQARDDPSLLLPLDVVWQERGATAHFLDRRFDHPHKRVLAGLGEAGQIFAPIAHSLEEPRPTGCDLSGEEAYQFLAEALPRFENAGFGIHVPSWWKQKSALKPQLKLNLRQRMQEGSGLLGMDALVSFDWKVALGDVDLSPDELERLVALKEPLVQLRGQWVELRPDDMAAVLRYVQARGKRKESLGEAFRAALTGRTEDGDLEIAEVRADGWIGDLLGRLREGEAFTEVEPPAGLQGTLRPYQRRGLSWLAFLAQYGLGACLADDMGLGKTISFLSLVQHLKEHGELRGPVLIVCPTSVVGNWRHEAERFTPDLRVLIHHGADRTGRKDSERLPEEVAQHDLVVTTYSLLPRDADALGKLAWSIVALDEAQNIKNADTKQSRAARKLFAPIRIALTGTPVENRLDELWSIMDFLNPGYLGTRTNFAERFTWQIEKQHDETATEQLRALVRPFILRRLKTDPDIVSDLPEKIEMREYCSLTREQVTLYQAVVRDGLRKLEEAPDPMSRRGIILGMLTRLKQVCNHPAHFLGDGSALAGRSGKLIRLEELIEEMLDEGDRALIFTQFTALGDRLQAYLHERFGVEVAYLHGGVPRKQRDTMVEHFQGEDGPPIFVLSLKAGGTGLNLTRANQVIHFDRWWNPAVENQATDRAFRIGQTRNVQVRKFVCSGTLEDRIDQLIEQKRGLAEQVIGAGEGWLTELSTTELREVLRLRTDAM